MQKNNIGVVRSISEELKKVAYLGAAGPYLVFGESAKTAVTGAELLAIAIGWFIICQTIAHFLVSLAEKMEVNNG